MRYYQKDSQPECAHEDLDLDMPQLITISRAARLLGMTRGELQKRVRDSELESFEGKVRASDLLRAFPEVRLEDDSALERVRRIKAAAMPRQSQETELPAPEVIATRLTALSRELIESKTELGAYYALAKELEERLADLKQRDDSELRTKLCELTNWFGSQLKKRPGVPKRKTQLLTKDTFLRMISAQVKVIPSGHDFFVEGSDSVLEAALRSGLALRYGCSSGTCGTCKARALSGEVLKVREHEYAISDTEQHLGYFLMCSYTAVTDLKIEAAEAHLSTDIPQQEVKAKVKQLAHANGNTVILYVRTPLAQRLRFLAGQRVTLALERGVKMDLPLASCPCDGQNLEFHIPLLERSKFVKALCSGEVHTDQVITIAGPKGDFVLRVDTPNPILFLAYGTGFAPIKSLLETAISIAEAESYSLVWAVGAAGQHYMDNRCRSWNDALDNFHYTPLFLPSQSTAESGVALLNATLAEVEEIERYVIYGAGPQWFIDAVQASPAQHACELITCVLH